MNLHDIDRNRAENVVRRGCRKRYARFAARCIPCTAEPVDLLVANLWLCLRNLPPVAAEEARIFGEPRHLDLTYALAADPKYFADFRQAHPGLAHQSNFRISAFRCAKDFLRAFRDLPKQYPAPALGLTNAQLVSCRDGST